MRLNIQAVLKPCIAEELEFLVFCFYLIKNAGIPGMELAGIHSRVEAGLEFLFFLHPPPEYRDYSGMPPWQV